MPSSLQSSIEAGQLPIRLLEGEPALDPDYRPAAAARAERGSNLTDVRSAHRAVIPEREHVAGKHVDPAQAAPALRPDRTLAVIGDRRGDRLGADHPCSTPAGSVAERALCPPGSHLGHHPAQGLLGERIEQHHRGAGEDDRGRDRAGGDLDRGQSSVALTGGAGDVAADPDRECRQRAADRLAGLARKRQEAVAAALGACPGLPLAVIDRVGLEGEDQGVDRPEADSEQRPRSRSRAAGSEPGVSATPTPASAPINSRDDVGSLLTDGVVPRSPNSRSAVSRTLRRLRRASTRSTRWVSCGTASPSRQVA